MTMAIRVPDADALSDATNAALALTTELGGHVAASNVDTDGSSGEARLTPEHPGREGRGRGRPALRARDDHASERADRQTSRGGSTRARSRSTRIQRAIEADELRLASGTLTAEEKLLTELRLAGNRADLREVRRVRALLAKQAANAELALTLRTGSEPAGSKRRSGRGGGSRRRRVRLPRRRRRGRAARLHRGEPVHRARRSWRGSSSARAAGGSRHAFSTSRAPARPHGTARTEVAAAAPVGSSGTDPARSRAPHARISRDTLRREGCPSRGPPGEQRNRAPLDSNQMTSLALTSFRGT